MSGVIERLVENWLDSASERSFQLPFCFMLIDEGYNVVHLTRHCAMEMGKDVLAIDPSGVPCAYQLKGTPSERIKMSQWTSEIQSQVIKLVQCQITHPSIDPNIPHQSYLVTNGGLDEEVSHAIEALNRGWASQNLPYELKVMTRGDLLAKARKLREGLWPSEVHEVKALFELFLMDGRDLLSKKHLIALFESTIPFNRIDEKGEISLNEFRRIASSIALLCGIATSTYVNQKNHFAEIEAWVIYIAYLLSLAEKCGLDYDEYANELALAEAILKNALKNLEEEVFQQNWIVEGDIMCDHPFYNIRLTWLLGLIGILALWRWSEGECDVELDQQCRAFFKEHISEYVLWGEAAIPYILAAFYCYRKLDATPKPDFLFLYRLIVSLSSRNQVGSEIALPNPYYEIQDLLPFMIDNQLQEFMPKQLLLADLSLDDNFAGKSFYLEGIFHLFMRRNWKQHTKPLWSNVSKIQTQSFEPETPSDFFRWRSEIGKSTDRSLAPTQKWDDLKNLTSESEGESIPNSIRQHPILLMLFLCVFPHRASADLLRWLDTQMSRVQRP